MTDELNEKNEIGPEYIFPQDKPGTIISDKYERAGGMELRDYLAAQSLPGIEAKGDTLVNAAMNAAICAYAIADACLIVRKQPPVILANPKMVTPPVVS